MAQQRAQVRRSQMITTWGPGALIDLPTDAGIVGGLDTAWPKLDKLEPIEELRLKRKIALITGVETPGLYAPPVEDGLPWAATIGVRVYRFPEWVVVRSDPKDEGGRRRRLVHRKALGDKGRFEGRTVVPTRFVRACSHGHVEDLDWYHLVHGADDACRRPLWLVERGTGGDLADLTVRCDCGKSRGMHEAADRSLNLLGACRGPRPWLGNASWQGCGEPSRLLIRTASNAHFSQVLSALSLPEHLSGVEVAVEAQWETLQAVDSESELVVFRKVPAVGAALEGFDDADVLAAILKLKGGVGEVEPPVKLVELDALLAQPEGYEDDVPINPDFHARRLPDTVWRRAPLTDQVACVIQLHRLREVLALIGFTRFEAQVPDIYGEFETDVKRADLALDPAWFPAVENRGEGVFLQLRSDRVAQWLAEDAVAARIEQLRAGHQRWCEQRSIERPFPGGPYVLLHTLSHLLIGAVAMRCGYPASSIRERVYVDHNVGRYGLMLYTASPDAEGTLGGLVAQARHIGAHLAVALRAGALCSNDPVCAGHEPAGGMEGRWLHGASCHGCTLIAETSCEMRNDYLDRALAVPTLAVSDAAFFPGADVT
jgi:hypothetical protein